MQLGHQKSIIVNQHSKSAQFKQLNVFIISVWD